MLSKQILFTTTNKHKIDSASLILERYGFIVKGIEVHIDEIQAEEPKKVATDKAEKAFKVIEKPLIVMDSGLFIEDLNNFLGVYTKYILETIGEKGLMALTKSLPNNCAYVQRTIAFTDGKDTKVFQSRGYGTIIQEQRGENGWSYDKIFLVKGKNKTLAEMTDEEKVKVWGDAWDKLGEWLRNKHVH